MQVTKENFITARYIDNEKKNVEILYKDGDKNISHIILHYIIDIISTYKF